MANPTLPPIAKPSRRSFLRHASAAALTGVALAEDFAAAQTPAAAIVPFQLFKGGELAADARALESSPGNKNLVDAKAAAFSVVMTTETAKSAKEFEWHEGRDHIIQVLDGTTLYEVGGTPSNGRLIRAGEYLAPGSDGATKITLGKGDMLTIPRGTPHKRTTETTVTFLLISPAGSIKS